MMSRKNLPAQASPRFGNNPPENGSSTPSNSDGKQTQAIPLMPTLPLLNNKSVGDKPVGLAAEAIQSALLRTIPKGNLANYWQGFVPLKTSAVNGNPEAVTLCSITPTTPEDAKTVDRWYDADPDGGPSYNGNQKWREWWTETITKPSTNWTTYKLTSPDKTILGVASFVKDYKEREDMPATTWLKGIRIAPRCNSMMTHKPDYKGVGSALVTYGVVHSLDNENFGLGLNSTLGAEGFYEALKMSPRKALDGLRTSFYATGISDRLAALKLQFEKYAKLEAPEQKS